MKKKLRPLMMVATGLGLFAVASFAFDGIDVHADIPFSFVAGDMTLPPGNYIFAVDDPNEPESLLIQSPDGTKHDVVLTETGVAPGDEPAGQSRLVFDRYGDQHYLAEIWVAGMDEGRAIPMSQIARERTAKLEHERMSVPLRR